MTLNHLTCTPQQSTQQHPAGFCIFWRRGCIREGRVVDGDRSRRGTPEWSTSARGGSRRNLPPRGGRWTSGSWTEPASTGEKKRSGRYIDLKHRSSVNLLFYLFIEQTVDQSWTHNRQRPENKNTNVMKKGKKTAENERWRNALKFTEEVKLICDSCVQIESEWAQPRG